MWLAPTSEQEPIPICCKISCVSNTAPQSIKKTWHDDSKFQAFDFQKMMRCKHQACSKSIIDNCQPVNLNQIDVVVSLNYVAYCWESEPSWKIWNCKQAIGRKNEPSSYVQNRWECVLPSCVHFCFKKAFQRSETRIVNVSRILLYGNIISVYINCYSNLVRNSHSGWTTIVSTLTDWLKTQRNLTRCSDLSAETKFTCSEFTFVLNRSIICIYLH